MSRRNIHEELGRARKVAALTLGLEAFAKHCGVTIPELLDALTRWPESRWAEFAVGIGQHPPSMDKTVPAVRRMLWERVRVMRAERRARP